MTEYFDPQVRYSKVSQGSNPSISYYGRHGSRYLLNASQYNEPYIILKQAYNEGKLTEFGGPV